MRRLRRPRPGLDLTPGGPAFDPEASAAHILARFQPGQAGDDTVATCLAHGWSLAIGCKACPRLAEWTPPEPARRFAPDVRIADRAARLACAGAGGCGSREVAVFPHLFDGAWRWPPP